MKFQIILAAIFAFATVSTKKWGFSGDNAQVANLSNCAGADGHATAVNCGFIGNANACVGANAGNCNQVGQFQGNYN